ncbi:peptidoglycan-recognition protein LC-like isoform X1 [Maniola jurtina]|uniref:peptidoglycan-recognition protein LC-like isoform X1 n=1 Tax=Maniola jurtina TaxID=191418 RepID=UPI001E68F91F|nr:peptidoglycan-recognition protein LC-like isoform X1 [Maniola jurtina]
MALNLDRSNSGRNLGVRVSGDLGDLQVTDATSDCDDKISDNEKVSRTVNTVNAISNLPPNLMHNTAIPSFGRVAITNSENVQFGNNTYFNGPVTIKQIVQSKSGVDNSSYTRSDDENISGGDHSTRGKVQESLDKKEQILVWHKITFSAVCIIVIGSIIAVVLVLQNKNEPQQQSTNGFTQPDFTTLDPSADTPVVGFCYESFQVIILSIVVLPLAFVLIFYSLLTKESIGNNAIRKHTVHENCMDKYCMQCNAEGDPLLIAPDHLRIVSRTDWLAQPVEGELDKLVQPVPWVIITHTATENCHTQSQCVLRVRLIQTFHIESKGWYDIGYNFLIGGDGSVYFGRGWDYQGAHTKGYNKYSIGIAFIGTFNNDPPPKQQVEACQKIIRQGVQLGKLRKDYKLFVHRQLMSTLSPGDKVIDIVKEWPHYVSNFTDIESLIPKIS